MQSLSSLASSELGVAAANAWRWWLVELAAMWPERIEPWSRASNWSDVRVSRQGVEVERIGADVGQRFKNDIRLERFGDEDWEQLLDLVRDCRVRFILEPPYVYATTITLPRAARGRVRAAVALQIAELSPLDPHLVEWSIGKVVTEGETLSVPVMLVRKTQLDELSAIASGQQLNASIYGQAGSDLLELRAIRTARIGELARWCSNQWLIMAALIAAIPVAILIAAGWLASSNQSEIARLRDEVRPKLALERQLRQREQLRAAVALLTARSTASMLLDDLAGLLPKSVHLRDIAFDEGGGIRLTAVASDPDVAKQALAADPLLPHLRQVDQAPAEQNGINLVYRAGRP